MGRRLWLQRLQRIGMDILIIKLNEGASICKSDRSGDGRGNWWLTDTPSLSGHASNSPSPDWPAKMWMGGFLEARLRATCVLHFSTSGTVKPGLSSSSSSRQI
jgi:hypothetical protein